MLTNVELCNQSDQYNVVLVIRPKAEKVYIDLNGEEYPILKDKECRFKMRQWGLEKDGTCKGWIWFNEKGWFWADSKKCVININDFEIIGVDQQNGGQWSLTIFKEILEIRKQKGKNLLW